MKTKVDIEFHASKLPGGADAILGPSQCGKDVVEIDEYTIVDTHTIKVKVTLDETEPRVAKVLALLDEYGAKRWVSRYDEYTEDERQAAPLLAVGVWGEFVAAGARYGTTYDMSQACARCGTRAQQTSPLIIDRAKLKAIEKQRIVETSSGDVLVRDVDVERLLAAGVTGALFWPVHAKTKGGDLEELRWQQLFIEHVLPPMSPKTLLDRSQVCPECKRGYFTYLADHPGRYMYRREDLANIQDVNLTWEWFGQGPFYSEPLDMMVPGRQSPLVLVTPKVMNLLRGKTKKEKKYQGCEFVPIWVDDGSGAKL